MSDSHNQLARIAKAHPALVWAFGLDRPNLTDRPQPFGILPSLRFWNRLDTWKPQLPFVVAGLGLIVVACEMLLPAFAALLGVKLASLVLLPLLVLLGVLPLGVFERWLRQEIGRRRGSPVAAIAARAEPPASI